MQSKFIGVALLLAAAPAWSVTATSVKADVSSFAASKAEIEADLKQGERYSELTMTQREEVREALARMEDRLQGVSSIAELSAGERAGLMNDQEFVNTVLTNAAEDSRLICKQERKTGSHRPITTCKTVAERKRERENSQHALRSMQKSHQSSPSGER